MIKLRPNPKFDNILMSRRTSNCLANNKINSIDELIQWKSRELLLMPNFGMTSLNEITEGLADRGLFLAKDPVRAIESEEGEKLFGKYQIAKLEWEIFKYKYELKRREILWEARGCK